ncbi:MAG: hypothetical protein OET90_07070 [Desulfuromonadales bacterium]|nr:hypothetical protein [Desulfuromonadales bacterium]
MAINWLIQGGHETQNREVISEQDKDRSEIIQQCYCSNGHTILTDAALFQGHNGLTLKLRNGEKEGLLVLSPIIGDHDRRFIGFERAPGEIVDISCPTCNEPFPIYNECPCGAHLVALFTSDKANFSKCIGICQRLGCLHSELLSERDLRLYNRQSYF